jgi:hypothetical protein
MTTPVTAKQNEQIYGVAQTDGNVCWLMKPNSGAGAVTCTNGWTLTSVEASEYNSLAVTADDVCTGGNTLGNGKVTCLKGKPTETFARIAAGPDYFCGVDAGGTVKCWNAAGPVASPLPAGKYGTIAIGREISCGVRWSPYEGIACSGGVEILP